MTMCLLTSLHNSYYVVCSGVQALSRKLVLLVNIFHNLCTSASECSFCHIVQTYPFLLTKFYTTVFLAHIKDKFQAKMAKEA